MASTGFTLIKTGPSTGVFEGIFKVPTKICNKSGTELISYAGGSISLHYHDFRDLLANQTFHRHGNLAFLILDKIMKNLNS